MKIFQKTIKKYYKKRINELIDDNDKLEDFIELYNDIIKEEQGKIYNKLDKFKDYMVNNMDNLEKKAMDKENNLTFKINKINDNVEKQTNIIKKSINIIYVM